MGSPAQPRGGLQSSIHAPAPSRGGLQGSIHAAGSPRGGLQGSTHVRDPFPPLLSTMPSPPIPPEHQTKALIEAEINRLVEFRTRLERRSHFTNSFKPLEKLGRGGEGSVKSMAHGGGVVAVKKLKQAYRPDNTSVPTAHNEVRMLALLVNVGDGPGRDTICRPATDEMWYPCTPDLQSQVVVLEFCALGSLWDYMQEQCFIDAEVRGGRVQHRASWNVPHEGLLRHVYTQLLEGLAFLHCGYGTTAFGGSGARGPVGRKPVVHRDLKPNNVLVCPAKPGDHEALVTVKISDFGGAAEVDGHRSRALDKGLYFFTRGYVAPEFMKDGVSRSTVDQANDVFAMGATMHYCVVGHGPWKKDRADGNRPVFHRRDMRELVHRGGGALSDDLVKSVADAVTYRQHRKDALTILETLKRGNAAHRRDFVRWMVDVEGPRIEKWREEQRQRELREEQRQRELREAEARERDELEIIRLALPTMCMVPDCSNAPLPHTHRCAAPETCYTGTINHAHMLFALYGTWADPRFHLACDLHMARYPNEDMQRAINLILLKAKALKLLRGSWLDEVV